MKRRPAWHPSPQRPGASAARTHAARRAVLGLLAALLLGVWPGRLHAQAQPPGPPGRYLLLVETSEAMRPRAAAMLRAIETLLASSMNGQFRAGDTLGVWTYNDELHAGELPLQLWTPQTEPLLTSNVVAFLKAQPCQRGARLDAVWPELEERVRDPERLTVIWITTGGEPIRGTPFDAQINDFFRTHAPAQTADRMPFIIVLRAQQGAFCGVTLNLAPWPVLLPAFPPWIAQPKPAEPPPAPKPASKPAEPKPAERAAPAAPPAPAARAEPIVRPPLIIVGKKDEPSAPPATATETASPKPGPPAPAEETKPTPTPAPKAIEPASPSTPAPKPPSEPPAAVAQPQPAAPPAAPAPPVATPATPPAAPTAAEPKPTPPAPAVEPSESSAKPAAATPAPSSSAESAGPLESSKPATAATNPAPTIATATPGANAAARLWWVWLAGGIAAVGALTLWWWVRRSRAAQRASLITRSLDAQRRPPD